jgi:hypothetical protein
MFQAARLHATELRRNIADGISEDDRYPAGSTASDDDYRTRSAMGLVGYQRNRPDRPSKTPQGRQHEYAKARAKRKAARGAGALQEA